MHLPRRTATALADRFDVRAETGAGGMGIVYRAIDRLTGADVALKLLNDGPGGPAERFHQEAVLLAELQHPAIVRYVDHGTTPSGEHYLAMEWLEGHTLDVRLASGPLRVGETLRLGRRVLEALAVAHRKGVVHRDLKPANLFLPGGDLAQVKLLDFGIARRLFDARRITSTGAALGTPMYMSPEQVRGSKQLDSRSDIFSLGAVLFECALGEPPFQGETPMAVLAKICVDEPVDIVRRRPDLPLGFTALLARMLAKDPGARPASAAHLAAEIGALLEALAADGHASGVHAVGNALRVPRPLLATDEQRIVSAIMVSRPRVPESPANDTWDVPSTVTRQQVSEDPFGDDAFALIRGALEPFGARADRFLGGSLVVTLVGQGAPIDQAAQAARCALKIKSLLPRASLAVCTGRGVVEGKLPLGDVIDGAARLLGRASAGAIRVDELTAGLLEARFELHRRDGDTELRFEKGVKEAPRTLLGREIPCVGRDRELGTLGAIYDECVGEPVARAVLVTAPAGGGKSRVRHELLERIQRRGDSFEYLVGRGESLRAGAPFGLLGPALRAAAGILGGETPEVQQKRLTAHVCRHVGDERARRVAAFLGEMAGVAFPDDDLPPLKAARADARLMADQMLSAWLDFIEAACAAQPVVLVLEDLHWGDAPSVQFVDAALRTLRDRPLLVLAFARPEVDDRFPGLWGERDLQRLPLPPLTARAAQKLARAALGEVADDKLAWLIERADGNPFYLEELLRAVSEGGEASARGLPDTIVGMVQARLDALGPEAKRVLRAASVYGQSFRSAGLRALVGEADVAAWLDILAKKEVVYARQAADTREYVFRHALVQEAAYAMLTARDRALGHKLAGEFLEASGEPDAIVLVEHFDRGGELARAARWCVRAAEQALEGNDLAAVIERVDRGVRLGAEGDALAAMKVVEAQARYWRGEYAEQERAARLGLAARSPRTWLAAVRELIAALGQMTSFDEMDGWVERAKAADVDESSRPAHLECLFRAASYLVPGGRVSQAQAILDASPPASELPPWLAARRFDVEAKIALAAAHQGRALQAYQQVLAAVRELGDLRSAAEAMANVGMTLADVGDLEAGEKYYAQALQHAERFGLGYVRACLAANRALVLVRLKRCADARDEADRARVLARRQGDRRVEGFAEICLALAARCRQDWETARKHADRASTLLRAVPVLLPFALSVLSSACSGAGNPEQALALAQEAVRLLDEAGYVEDGEAFIRLTVVECLIAAGRMDAARTELRRAYHRLEQRTAALETDGQRLAFLRHIPENASTLALVARFAASPADACCG